MLRMAPPAITAKPLRRDEVGAGFTARNLPDGQIKCDRRWIVCPVLLALSCKNILIFRNRKSVYIHSHPVPHRGRFAVVTNAGWDVMDARASARMDVAGRVEPRERLAGAQDERRLSVRQNRVVLTPVAGAKSAVANPTRPGWAAANPPTTVTRRIRRRGEHGISCKAITQGMPDASAEPVCSCVHPHFPLRTRPRVQRAPGIPCALALEGGKLIAKLGRIAPRECEGVSPHRRPGERRDPLRRGLSLKDAVGRLSRNTTSCGYGSRLLVRNCALGRDDVRENAVVARSESDEAIHSFFRCRKWIASLRSQ
jgi:hypothetical protein